MVTGRIKVALTAFILVSLIGVLPQVEQLERRFYDIRMKTLAAGLAVKTIDKDIRLISVEDTSLSLGWSDANTLALISQLQARGASAVVVCGEELFLDSARSLKQLPEGVLLASDTELLRLDEDDRHADPDGRVRSLPHDHPSAQLARSLASKTGRSRAVEENSRIEVLYKDAVSDTTGVLSNFSLRPLPIHRFQGYVSELPESLDGLVFLLGRFSPQNSIDFVDTPIDMLHSMQFMACLIDTHLEGWELKPLNTAVDGFLWLFLTLATCLLLSGRHPLIVLIGGLGLSSTVLWSSFQAFAWGYDARGLRLSLTLALATVVLLAIDGMRAQGLLATFGGQEDAQLAGEETTASILFTILPPHLMEMEKRQDANLLTARRQYTTAIQRVCQTYGGRVLDYQGDAQMIGFGLKGDPEHPVEATSAALEIIAQVGLLASEWQVPPEKVRVHAGVCTGPVALGHVGAEQKKDLAAIGDTSNTAARLMGAAMKQQVPVLLSEPTYLGSSEWVTAEALPPVRLKGKREPVAIYSAQSVSEEWQAENSRRREERGPEGGVFELTAARGKSLLPTLILSFCVFIGVLLVNHFGLFRVVENAVYDWRQRVLFPTPADQRIVIVGITEESEEMLGPFPWSRGKWAYILEKLRTSECQGIFLDVLFKTDRQEDPDGDQSLADAVAADTRVVIGGALVQDRAGLFEAPVLMSRFDQSKLRKRGQIGLVHKSVDFDQVLRWGMLAAATTEDKLIYPAAAVALLQGPDDKISLEPFQVAELRVPRSGRARYMRIRYGPTATRLSGREREGYQFVDIWRLVDGMSLEEFKGKYLLIGDTYSSGPRVENDRVDTPVGSIKGVEGHARILDTLLNGNFLVPVRGLVEFLWLVVVSLLTIQLLTRRQRTGRALPSVFGLLLAHVAINTILFSYGYVAALTLPAVMMIAITGAVMLGRYLLTRTALSGFVPGEIVDELLYDHGAKDRRVTATILLTDIRGYTTISETKSAVQMMDILNEYHKRTVACYERFGGQALTYQGDAQIVVFGVFGDRTDPAVDGVHAALELQDICTQLRAEWEIERQEDFDVGAGLCTGEVEVGIMGAGNQRQYSVIGETVRTSHKVQGMSDELQAPVILDEATLQACRGKVKVDDLGMVHPKGLDREVRLYRALPRED